MLLRKLAGLPAKIARTSSFRSDPDTLVLHWARKGVVGINWGDKLNPVLARMISGRNVVHAFDVFPLVDRPLYYMVGSSLEHAQRKNAVVWGVGFISGDQGLRTGPAEICAVRGYRSIERLRSLGIQCPDVVGDPALLLPRFYVPRPLERRYRVGIIPHCFELDLAVVREDAVPHDALLIDITGDIFDVVDQINACDEVLSSSLHGLICSESYGVPSRWVQLSDRPVGDGFKFHDYYSSIGKTVSGPVRVSKKADWEAMVGSCAPVTNREALRALGDRLLSACPFWPGSR